MSKRHFPESYRKAGRERSVENWSAIADGPSKASYNSRFAAWSVYGRRRRSAAKDHRAPDAKQRAVSAPEEGGGSGDASLSASRAGREKLARNYLPLR